VPLVSGHLDPHSIALAHLWLHAAAHYHTGKLTSMAASIGCYVANKLFRRSSSGADVGPDDTSARSSKAQSSSESLASVTLSSGNKLSKGERVRCRKGDGVVARILSNQLWKEPYICIALDLPRPSSPKRNKRYLQEAQDALQEASEKLALPAASVFVCAQADAVKLRALPCVRPYEARAQGQDSVKYLCAVCDAVTPAKRTVNCDDSAQQQGGHTVCLKHIEPSAGDGALTLTDRLTDSLRREECCFLRCGQLLLWRGGLAATKQQSTGW
jgi:hypothetical protein